MKIEEIKALYAKRDEAYSLLQSANLDLESEVYQDVMSLAEKAVLLQSGNKTFWNDCRLREPDFNPETETFTLLIEVYQGSGKWETEYDEDGEEDLLCARVPAKWLDMEWSEISKGILEEKALKEAKEQALRDAKIAQAVKEMEARERADLARLSAKYHSEGTKS